MGKFDGSASGLLELGEARERTLPPPTHPLARERLTALAPALPLTACRSCVA
jgi:hypothetical protein